MYMKSGSATARVKFMMVKKLNIIQSQNQQSTRVNVQIIQFLMQLLLTHYFIIGVRLDIDRVFLILIYI